MVTGATLNKKVIYRVNPIFNHYSIYSMHYVIQKKIKWFGWRTISRTTDLLDQVIRDCKTAQELYDKYSDSDSI
jgi:hypothetical protein